VLSPNKTIKRLDQSSMPGSISESSKKQMPKNYKKQKNQETDVYALFWMGKSEIYEREQTLLTRRRMGVGHRSIQVESLEDARVLHDESYQMSL